jgi:hypothetical protein
MSLNRRLSRLEQDIGEALDAANATACERLSPEELALWEELLTAISQVHGLPHDPDTVRAEVEHSVTDLERREIRFSLEELRRLTGAYRRLAERDG